MVRGDSEVSVPKAIESIIRTGYAGHEINKVNYDRFKSLDKTHYERFPPTAEPLYIMKHRGDVRTNADTVFQA